MYGRFREIQGDMWRLGAHVEHEEEGRARQPHAQQLHERVQQAVLDGEVAQDGHGEQQPQLQRPAQVRARVRVRGQGQG